MSISNDVQTALTPIISGLGYVIVEVEFAKKQDGNNLTIFIDKKGGVSLDDCVLVHNAIDAPLDELDPTKGEHYILNVSSPGLDRPIKTDADLERNMGEKLEANTFVKVGARKHFEGVLTGYTQSEITLDTLGGAVTLERKNISKLNKFIEF